jgi:hypothetical protein
LIAPGEQSRGHQPRLRFGQQCICDRDRVTKISPSERSAALIDDEKMDPSLQPMIAAVLEPAANGVPLNSPFRELPEPTYRPTGRTSLASRIGSGEHESAVCWY